MNLTIDSITVTGFRGIPGTETFHLDGNHSVVVGPNGTGKSTITQALEFLLTGQVTALSGSGTGRINDNEHIPNHNVDPSTVKVEAVFRGDGGETFSARREFTSRSSLDAERRPKSFRTLLKLADRGLMLLTRDELLDLVVTTPGTRKDQLQKLLDLSGIDKRRRQLKRLKRNAANEADSHARKLNRAKKKLEQTLDIASLDDDAILEAANELRTELDGDPLESLEAGMSFRVGLNSPAEQAMQPLQRSGVQNTVGWLHTWLSEEATPFHDKRDDISELLSALQADTEALNRVSQLQLVRQGQEMVTEETENCPLCLAEWQPGEVQKRLEARRRRLNRIEERTEELRNLSADIRREANDVATKLKRLRNTLEDDSVDTSLEPLVLLHGHMTNLLDTFDKDLVNNIAAITPSEFDHHIDTDTPLETIESLQAEADSIPAKSDLQEVWDDLHEAARAWESLSEARAKQAEYERIEAELDTAHSQFLLARDDVLQDVYSSIAARFEDFYTRINPDEEEMTPSLDPTNTGVEFSVGFYGDGEHPPHALHSEGHQDSMGVCLFLALADHFSPLERTPIMLDGIVMSVDKGHRRRVADVFAKELADDFQFIITTHDDRWAKQLVRSGLLDQNTVQAFDGWSPQHGPNRMDFVK